PTIVAQVDTPGIVTSVACDVGRVVVAEGTEGVAIIDLTDPPNAQITYQIRLGSPARAVAVSGTVAYVGLDDGDLAAIDVVTGTVLDRVRLGSLQVDDLALEGDHLY